MLPWAVEAPGCSCQPVTSDKVTRVSGSKYKGMAPSRPGCELESRSRKCLGVTAYSAHLIHGEAVLNVEVIKNNLT